MLKLRLIPLLCLVLLACFIRPNDSAQAQDVKALPVPSVETESLPELGEAPVIVELFSSQACVFCPRADRLFADIIKQKNVIGLACHVDYFDVDIGSLAKSFCTDRQSWYMDALAAGPHYTPQIVINGREDVIGYKFDKVVSALQKSAFSQIKPLPVKKTAENSYAVDVPLKEIELDQRENLTLWVALYDKPHEITIAQGRNKGERAVYYNIVSSLGQNPSIQDTMLVKPPIQSRHAGFAVLLQDTETGRIYAAGQWSFTETKQSKNKEKKNRPPE